MYVEGISKKCYTIIKYMKQITYFIGYSTIVLLLLGVCVHTSYAAMTGGSYEIIADSFQFSGSEQIITGGDFALTDTGGEFFATTTQAGTYELVAGFQSAEKDASLSLFLNANAISFGELSLGSVTAENITASVSSADEGYVLLLTEDGNLRTVTGNTIDDVSDGEVSSGSEEYGIKTIGGHGVLATDTPIQGTVTVANFSGSSESIDTIIQFRAAIGSQSLQGSYSHTVTFSLVEQP